MGVTPLQAEAKRTLGSGLQRSGRGPVGGHPPESPPVTGRWACAAQSEGVLDGEVSVALVLRSDSPLSSIR